MHQGSGGGAPPNAANRRPAYAFVLRALRDARGVTQEGWAAALNYSVATIRRWETGSAAPTADAEAALLRLCQEHGLFRTYAAGPLRGFSLTPELLRNMLAAARLEAGDRSRPAAPLAERDSIGAAAAPTLPGASNAPAANLPFALSSFVGRTDEIAIVRRLVGASRLVTLTGPGGVGKTRLALEVAREMAPEFANATIWVDLASLTDPRLLHSAVAQALDLRGADEPLAAVRAALHTLRLLLVLDNFEQVLAAAPDVLELLAACPQVHVLVTSRAALRVRGEQVFPVPPLSLPDAVGRPELDALARSDAVSLLVKRAQEVRPSFALAPENAGAIVAICRRLDGLPLALELAAARLQVLTPDALLGRLDQHLKLLVGGPNDLPARQQTLRATMDWSYNALDPQARQLLRRMAVFAGGCSLQAVEVVCGDQDSHPLDLVDALSRLVSHSLVGLDEQDGELRYRLLETVRQYAFEKLEEANEADATRTRHLDWCLHLVEEAEPRLGGPQQGAWMARLDLEHDNVRSALRWGLDRGLCERVVRLGGAFWRFWWTRARFPEGRRWLEELLQLECAVEPGVRARLLEGAGWMADVLGDLPCAEQRFQQALSLRRAVGEPRSIATTLGWLSFEVAASGDLERAISLTEEAAAVARQHGDTRTLAQALTRLGTHLTMAGDAERGAPLLEQAVDLARQAGDLFTAAAALDSLGLAERLRGHLSRAVSLLEEALHLVDEIGYSVSAAEVRYQLADALWRTGRIEQARDVCLEGLRLAHAGGDTRRVANALRVAAAIEAAERHHGHAVILGSASEAVLSAKGIRFMPAERTELDSTLALAETELAAQTFGLARAFGTALDMDQAFSWAMSSLAVGPGVGPAAAGVSPAAV